jgi:hypothetical protein
MLLRLLLQHMIKKNNLSVIILIFFPLVLNSVLEHQKTTTIVTVTFCILFYFVYKNVFLSSDNLIKFNLIEVKFLKSNIFYILLLLTITILTQNKYLNIETITWDVPSYLVASQEINNGFLPFTTQWESKGPFFLYLYNFVSNLANRNYLYFRLLNDLILFSSILFLYLSVKISTESKLKAFCTSLFFILVTSHVWFISEFSEIYCLTFISLNYFLYKRYPESTLVKFFIGSNFALATLVNQGTIIFIIPYYLKILNKKRGNIYIDIKNMSLGFLIPHIFFIIFYYLNNLLNLYIAQYVQLPLNYVSSSNPSISELFVISRRILQYDYFLFFALISTAFFILTKAYKSGFKNQMNIEIMNFLIAVMFFFIAGHNYQHHLFYAIYFFIILFSTIDTPAQTQFVYVLIFCSTLTIGSKTFEDSILNLSNTTEIYNDYPLKKLSVEIKQSVGNENFDILALDYVLVLYYLNLPNTSYIVHPGNHSEEYIVKQLLDLNMIQQNEFNHVSFLIEEEPKVIMCNGTLIIDGEPQKVDFYNCAIDDYKSNYSKLNTLIYEADENLNFYDDPYKDIGVYIREK